MHLLTRTCLSGIYGYIQWPSSNTSSKPLPCNSDLVWIECTNHIYFVWGSTELTIIPCNVQKICSRNDWHVLTAIFALCNWNDLNWDFCLDPCECDLRWTWKKITFSSKIVLERKEYVHRGITFSLKYSPHRIINIYKMAGSNVWRERYFSLQLKI